eukprot:TRINITY_DN4046_c0_g3_i9.p1 TRINITY_DN4046_c0_g3~~TRINITY_DN4046_c0_g3_i9.p1  ORF type:complete len:109 (-),score=51.68 TRINITY_DN4046_c0_g3_i9:241-567(-)
MQKHPLVNEKGEPVEPPKGKAECADCNGTGVSTKKNRPCKKCLKELHPTMCHKCCGTKWDAKKNKPCKKCAEPKDKEKDKKDKDKKDKDKKDKEKDKGKKDKDKKEKE